MGRARPVARAAATPTRGPGRPSPDPAATAGDRGEPAVAPGVAGEPAVAPGVAGEPAFAPDTGGEPAVAPGAGGEPGRDPEAALEQARAAAWRSLNRRDRTVAELREALARREAEPEVAEQVVAELLDLGYLDDAAFARRFAEDRQRLDGWGAERIAHRLRALGVAEDHVAAALADRDADDELDGAVALLARRFRTPPTERRERDRALGVLLRRGYAAEVALDALRRFGRDA